MDHHAPSWSDLESNLLLDIAGRLHSRIDRLRLRAVCHSWRSLLPPPDRVFVAHSPTFLLPFPMGPNPYIHPLRSGYFKLVESTVYFFQPLKKISDPWKTSKWWLVRTEESENEGKVRLLDPLVGIGFNNLPPRRLNLLDYKISEVTKLFRLRYEDTTDIPLELNIHEIKSTYAMKVALCSDGTNFAIMAVHTAGQLSFWEKGDEEWTRVIHDGREGVHYDDVVYRKGMFYAVDSSGFTIMIDLKLNITQVAPAVSLSDDLCKHLVPCFGDLFLLDRTLPSAPDVDYYDGEFVYFGDDDCVSTDIQVYKLNEEMQKWVRVKSLGDRAIFVGNLECNFSVSAKEFPGCKKNCIYLDQTSLNVSLNPKCDHPGFNAALFDLEDCSASMLSEVYGYSGLFWPPPSWIIIDDASSLGR